MRNVRAFLRRVTGTMSSSRREREMADEIESHLQLHIDDNLRAGMTPTEARRQALLKFGPVERIKDDYRDRAGLPVVRHIMQDLRFAVRLLRKAPVFSLSAIVTIAFAIGANAAIFTVFNAAALQPLRTPQSDALVTIALRLEGPGPRGVHGVRSLLSFPEFTAVRDQVRAFSGALAYSPFNTVTLGGAEPRQILATVASCEYFDVLRVRAAIGRTFVRADCDRAAPAVIVLTNAAWRSWFNAEPTIVGKAISINRTPFTVIGVTPAGFTGAEVVREDVFVPVAAQTVVNRGRNFLDNANMSWLHVIGRLADGASKAEARRDLAVVAGRLTAAEHAGRTFHLDAGRATLSGLPETRDLVLGAGAVTAASVMLVLLIACANIANLLLARSTARRREFAVRMVLGASRARLVQQLLTESLLLSVVGGTLGVLTALWGARTVVRFILAHLPRGVWPMTFDPLPDGRVLVFAACVTTLTGLAFGLVPALRSTREAAGEFRSTTSTDGHSSRRLQQALIAVQLAVCVVLLISGGLLGRGLYRARTIDPGLAMDSVSVVAIDLGAAGYSRTAAVTFLRRLVDRLSNIPGVRAVAATTAVPLSDQHMETPFQLDGSGQARYLEFSQVSSGYFDVLGIRFAAGRTFTAEDAASQRAAIVTESTARRLWPGADPLAHAVTLDNIPRPIVGVVRDAQISRLGQSDSFYVFLPLGALTQSVSHSSSGITDQDVAILVAGTPSTPTARGIAAAVREIDPDVAVDVAGLSENLQQWRAPSIVLSALAGVLGLLALGLACTGVFGAVAYTVSRRTREIGIRIALGATRHDLGRLIVHQGMRPVMIGMLVGLAVAAAVSKVLSNMLFGLSPRDPLSFVGVTALLFGVALLACYVPARRALRVEPTTALRTD